MCCVRGFINIVNSNMRLIRVHSKLPEVVRMLCAPRLRTLHSSGPKLPEVVRMLCAPRLRTVVARSCQKLHSWSLLKMATACGSGAWVADSGSKTTLPRDASVAVVSWAAAHLASLTVHRLCQPGESISTACSIDTHQGLLLTKMRMGEIRLLI